MSNRKLSDVDNKLVAKVGIDTRSAASNHAGIGVACGVRDAIHRLIQRDLEKVRHLGPEIMQAVLNNALDGYLKGLKETFAILPPVEFVQVRKVGHSAFRAGSWEKLKAECWLKGIICERNGNKVELTTPDGGTTADCQHLREAFETLRGDVTFSSLPNRADRRIERI